jgi:hypothetical protein
VYALAKTPSENGVDGQWHYKYEKLESELFNQRISKSDFAN